MRRVCACLRPPGRAHWMDGMLRTVRFRAATAGRYYERLKPSLCCSADCQSVSTRCADRRLRPNPNPYALIGLANTITNRPSPSALGDGTNVKPFLGRRSSSAGPHETFVLARSRRCRCDLWMFASLRILSCVTHGPLALQRRATRACDAAQPAATTRQLLHAPSAARRAHTFVQLFRDAGRKVRLGSGPVRPLPPLAAALGLRRYASLNLRVGLRRSHGSHRRPK